MKPSPKNSAAPNRPTALDRSPQSASCCSRSTATCSAPARRLRRDCRRAARCATYLIEMTRTSDQRISDSRPRMFCCVDGDAVLGIEAFAEGVQRAGADVAEDHAESGEDELASWRRCECPRRAERACMGRALYSRCRSGLSREILRMPRQKPGLQRYSTTDASQRAIMPPKPAPSTRHHDQAHLPGIVRAELGRALHDQRAHHATPCPATRRARMRARCRRSRRG